MPSDPWGARVTWFDQDGEEDDDVTPEHRADEWAADALESMLLAGPDEDLLPPEPGQEALRWLARSMGRDWGYYPVAWEDGELVMETRKPAVQRVVIPRAAEVDRVGIRELVAEVARQKEERADQVLFSMMD